MRVRLGKSYQISRIEINKEFTKENGKNRQKQIPFAKDR